MAQARPLPEDVSGSPSRQPLPAAELRLRRQALGLTQAQLASRLGVRANTVARWERGEVRPIHPEHVERRLARLERAQAGASVADRAPRRQHATPLPHSSVPVQLTSFIGREHELADVRQLLASTRLLCLTGPGGIGKTRLAIQAANEFAGDVIAGICVVELASEADGNLVARSVARTLGVVERPHESLLETLAQAIGEKQLLLVLDNCEHLLAASAELTERLLRSCPKLRILATSREPLGIAGETVWRVPSLSVPERRDSTMLATLPRADAVRLFVERACAVAPGFTLSEQNAPAIAHLCRRLEGIPLALELAAARVPVLSVQQLADRVDDALRLLITGSRSAAPRQRTLRATVDWSYGLLSQSEKQLFARLSAFAGGFALEAAETVCAGYGIQREDVLELLASLVTKSLVLSQLRADGSVRYRLLETLRQFGAEQLRESGETAQVRDRHLGWILEEADRAAIGISGGQQADWFVWFDRELGNVRTALDWTVENSNAAAGLRLGAALQFFWLQGGHMAEARSRLEVLLNLPSASADPSAHVAGLVVAAHLTMRFTGDPEVSGKYAEQALAMARQIKGAPALRFEATRRLGWVMLMQIGDLRSADRLFQESIEAARDLGPSQVARGLAALGWVRVLQGDNAAGRSLIEDAVARLRDLGDWLYLAAQLCYVADIDIREGRYAEARRHATEALENTHLALPLAANWVRILDVFIRLAAAENQLERVVRLAGAASTVNPIIGISPLASPDQVARAKQELGDAKSAALWAEGQAMTVEETVAFMLSKQPTELQRIASTIWDAIGLTEREVQVLRMVIDGKSNREIGAALVLSVRTVERHIANVYSKLGVHGRVDATAYALRHGML
jgi:predicted ATPase/DNA-binding CsgD family transcriptional regulator/transcriptional regulator with XRE-family HTH domain